MTARPLEIPGYDGSLVLIDAGSADEAHVIARALLVPEGAFTSRAYRDRYALVAIGPTPVGVDLEIVDHGLTPDAVLTCHEATLPAGPEQWTSWWSAKEAWAKALGAARLYDPRRLESPALWAGGEHGLWRAAPLTPARGAIGWIVWARLSRSPPGGRPGGALGRLFSLNRQAAKW